MNIFNIDQDDKSNLIGSDQIMPKIVDHQQMRECIAKIACTTIAEIGLGKTTMRALATAADCSTGLISHYFPNKNAVLIAAIEYAAGQQLARLEAAFAQDCYDLPAVFAKSLPIAQQDRIAMYVWLALWSRNRTNRGIAVVHEKIHGAYLEIYARTLLAAGVVDNQAEADAHSMRLLAFVNGLSILALQDDENWPEERLMSELRYMLASLFPDQEPHYELAACRLANH